MAPTERKPDADLIELLQKQGKSFEFFRAVSLLERLVDARVTAGNAGPAADERIRFHHHPGLGFHIGDISSISITGVAQGDPRAVVVSTFLGLLGTASPLPAHMTEEVLFADANDETSLHSFYDFFHHRLIGLFYRTWSKYRLYIDARADSSDLATRRLMSFVGLDSGASPSTYPLSPGTLLGLAPLLALRARTPRSLSLALSRVLPGVHAEVENFIERRVQLHSSQRMLLGSQNTTLSVDITVGRTISDRSGRFRVKLGPVEHDMFEQLLPGGALFETLRKTIDVFSGGIAEAEVEVQLAQGAAPRFQLASARGAVLGRATRLSAKATDQVRSRYVLDAGEVTEGVKLSDAAE